MKIDSLAVSATAFLHLKSPAGDYLYDGKNKVGIEMFGPGSPEFSRIEQRQTARASKRLQDNDMRYAPPPVEVARAEAAEDLADLTVAFHHIDREGAEGQPLVGRALYLAVYSDASLGWIKEQAAKFTKDWSHFTQGSATS